jgi:hypothetical protein
MTLIDLAGYFSQIPDNKDQVSPFLPYLFCWFNNMAHNVGSYTQVRIAGDFLSSRKAARTERCTPKTTAAALDG